MTASARAFHHRHMDQSRPGGDDRGSSDSSDHDSTSDEPPDHVTHGGDDDMMEPPPPVEEYAFEHLMEAHFGVNSAGGMDGSSDDGGDEDDDWHHLNSLARTPLYTDASSSRYIFFTSLIFC